MLPYACNFSSIGCDSTRWGIDGDRNRVPPGYASSGDTLFRDTGNKKVYFLFASKALIWWHLKAPLWPAAADHRRRGLTNRALNYYFTNNNPQVPGEGYTSGYKLVLRVQPSIFNQENNNEQFPLSTMSRFTLQYNNGDISTTPSIVKTTHNAKFCQRLIQERK